MKKLLTMMLMIASVFFLACEDETEQLSKEEAVTELNNLDNDMSGYMEEMMNSDGMEAMDILMSMPDPFTSSKSSARTSVLPNIQKYLLPVNTVKEKSLLEAEPFDFDTYVGTYTYHHTPFAYWEVETGGDKIIINFPTDETNMGTNDGVLTIHNYNEVMISYYDDSYQTMVDDYYPTDILADIYVNDVKIVEIDLNATWETVGDMAGEPSSFDISVYLMPFEFTGAFDHTATAANIDFGINYKGESFFSAGVDATFENGDMDTPLTVGGYIQLLAVKVDADVDVKALEAIFEGLENQTSQYATMEELTKAINNEIDATVSVDGVKAADIEIQIDQTSEEMVTIVLVFSDGTTEPAGQYFDGFTTDIEDFFYFLDGVYTDW